MLFASIIDSSCQYEQTSLLSVQTDGERRFPLIYDFLASHFVALWDAVDIAAQARVGYFFIGEHQPEETQQASPIEAQSSGMDGEEMREASQGNVQEEELGGPGGNVDVQQQGVLGGGEAPQGSSTLPPFAALAYL